MTTVLKAGVYAGELLLGGMALVTGAITVRLVNVCRRIIALEECQNATSADDLLCMTITPPDHSDSPSSYDVPPSRQAGYCGQCREVIRLGETCCGTRNDWIGGDGLGWLDWEEYAVATAAGRMIDARSSGAQIPDYVLELPRELFIEALLDADTHEVISRSCREHWPDWRLQSELARLERIYEQY